MRKGIVAGIYSAVFVLICFLGMNAFHIWAVLAHDFFVGGFPLPYYNRFGYENVAALDRKAALLNYFITSSIALHVAFGVFALYNVPAILRRIIAGRNGKPEVWVRNGIFAGLRAAGFIMACFIAVNAYQIWGVYSIPSYHEEAGFPVICYSRGGIGAAWLDIEAVFHIYFIASSVALHVALSVFECLMHAQLCDGWSCGFVW
jgi:hypothetical protein